MFSPLCIRHASSRVIMCILHAKQSLCYDGRVADSNKTLADDDDDDDDDVMF